MSEVVEALLEAKRMGRLVVEMGEGIAVSTLGRSLQQDGYTVIKIEFAPRETTREKLTDEQFARLNAFKYFIQMDLTVPQDFSNFRRLLELADVAIDSRPDICRENAIYEEFIKTTAYQGKYIVLLDGDVDSVSEQAKASELTPEQTQAQAAKTAKIEVKKDVSFGLAVKNLLYKGISTNYVMLRSRDYQYFNPEYITIFYDDFMTSAGGPAKPIPLNAHGEGILSFMTAHSLDNIQSNLAALMSTQPAPSDSQATLAVPVPLTLQRDTQRDRHRQPTDNATRAPKVKLGQAKL